MKKLLAVIIVFALMFTLCACNTSVVIDGLEKLGEIELPPLPGEEAEESEAEPAETEPTAEPLPVEEVPETNEFEPANRVIVSISKTTLQHFAPDDGAKLLLTFAYDRPIVSIEGRDDAAHKINDFTAFLEEEHYTGMDGEEYTGYGFYGMIEQAEDNYRYVHDTGADLPIEYASSRAVDVLRADTNVLSLVYNDYVYTGGAHGNFGDRAYVFDTESGERLAIEDLCADYAALSDALTDYMANAAENDEEVSMRIDPNLIADGDYKSAFATLLRAGSWYLSCEGLVIFSDVYEFGSYAQGAIKFVVPYEELEGLIDAKWIPANVSGGCELSVVDKPAEGTEILDMINVDENGRTFYVVIDGIAGQLKLAGVQYADSFYETAEYWYCSYAENCALQISAIIPEGMPNLMLSYTDESGMQHNILISESGADGSLIITDDSIEAVG